MSLTTRARLAFAAVALTWSGALWAQEPSGGRQVAITFDDLPGVTVLDTDRTYLPPFNERLLRALQKHRVPAIGFVNEGKLQERTFAHGAGIGMLQQWIDAGFELGNHTHSHIDLHQVSLDEYQQDVVRGEAVTRRLMADAGKRVRFFRHTFLHTGRDAKTRDAFDAFLASRGYQVAPVTIDNYDYLFARAYDRAFGDGRPEEAVVDAYVDYMTRVVAYYEEQSRRFIGREIPQVLLLHANALNAVAFDRLAAMFVGRGYRFVRLEKALEDSAYRSRDEYYGAGGITWLHRWALTAGHRGKAFAGEPAVPDWIQKVGG